MGNRRHDGEIHVDFDFDALFFGPDLRYVTVPGDGGFVGVAAAVDGARFRKELSQLHGFVEGVSDGDAGLGVDEGVAVVAQVSSDNGFRRGLGRHQAVGDVAARPDVGIRFGGFRFGKGRLLLALVQATVQRRREELRRLERGRRVVDVRGRRRRRRGHRLPFLHAGQVARRWLVQRLDPFLQDLLAFVKVV